MTHGAEHEARALRYLEARGLKLVVRNFRSRLGELDLVMDDSGTVAVIEVRHRGRSDFGDALESVTARKRARILRAARWLLAARPELADRPVRFDVLAIDGADTIRWIRSAFDAEGD